MSDFELTVLLCSIVAAACCSVVWSMVAFGRHMDGRWARLQAILAERDRELQR